MSDEPAVEKETGNESEAVNTPVVEFTSLAESEQDGKMYLKITGYPVTPGVHNGRKWTQKSIKNSIMKLVGAPVGINHDYRKGLRGVVGHVSKVEWDPAVENYVATTMIHDPPTIKRVQSGELTAYSILGEVYYDRNSLEVLDMDYQELTLATKPIDPGAVHTGHESVFVAMSEDTQDHNLPPQSEAVLSQSGGNIPMSEPNENEQNKATAPATDSPDMVKLQSEQIALAQELHEIKLERQSWETEKTELKNAVDTEKLARETAQKNEADQKEVSRAQEVVKTVSEWVANGHLLPAQEKQTVDFLMGIQDEDRAKAFGEIMKQNKVQPFGGTEDNGAGIEGAVRDADREQVQSEGVNYSKLTDAEFGALFRAKGMGNFEQNGFFGENAYRKHLVDQPNVGFDIKGGE